MAAYYLYRISTSYDGFLPSCIPQRAESGLLTYNWGAYVESLEVGDIVLTYFTGTGCRDGIYAIAEIRSIDLTKRTRNVVGLLLHYSVLGRSPIIPVQGNEAVFAEIRRRPRGAEVVVPDTQEEAIYDLLAREGGTTTEAKARNIILPGAESLDTQALCDIPLINLRTQLSETVREKGVIAAYWIRPTQASWTANCPDWLRLITSIFGKLKAGDFSRLDELAGTLAQQVRASLPDVGQRVGLVIGVPLNAEKHRNGEVDRVRALAERLAKKIGVPFIHVFDLEGNVSRRSYKLHGYSNARFKHDYRRNLSVTQSELLGECVMSGREILLVDDVYTDGVTTETVIEALQEEFGDIDVQVHVATVGIMAKMHNMDPDLANRWR